MPEPASVASTLTVTSPVSRLAPSAGELIAAVGAAASSLIACVRTVSGVAGEVPGAELDGRGVGERERSRVLRASWARVGAVERVARRAEAGAAVGRRQRDRHRALDEVGRAGGAVAGDRGRRQAVLERDVTGAVRCGCRGRRSTIALSLCVPSASVPAGERELVRRGRSTASSARSRRRRTARRRDAGAGVGRVDLHGDVARQQARAVRGRADRGGRRDRVDLERLGPDRLGVAARVPRAELDRGRVGERERSRVLRSSSAVGSEPSSV